MNEVTTGKVALEKMLEIVEIRETLVRMGLH